MEDLSTATVMRIAVLRANRLGDLPLGSTGQDAATRRAFPSSAAG